MLFGLRPHSCFKAPRAPKRVVPAGAPARFSVLKRDCPCWHVLGAVPVPNGTLYMPL